MDSDLTYGIGVMTALTGVLFLVGVVAGERSTRLTSVLLLTLAVSLCVLYLLFLWDDILLANLLPFSNLIVVGNWLPLFSGFIAGLAWKSMPGSLFRRNNYAIALSSMGLLALFAPVVGAVPECSEKWDGALCLQTSTRTCTPACAATLLHLHGLTTSEREMAQLCLTRRGQSWYGGTCWQGLYRGLKLKTEGTEFDVEVLACGVDDLDALPDSPSILVVGVPADADPETVQKYIAPKKDGWGLGELHSVVFNGFDPMGNAVIGDPDVGWEHWSREDLRVLVRGRGIRLVHRN